MNRRPSTCGGALAALLASCVSIPEHDVTLQTGDTQVPEADAAPGFDAAGGTRVPPDGAAPGFDLAPTPGDATAAGLDLARQPDATTRDAFVTPDDGIPRLPPQNALGPGARVTSLYMPRTFEDATDQGCQVEGASNGSVLYPAFDYSGEPLDAYVRPREDGRIDVVILAQALGWAAGEPVADIEQIDLVLTPGRQTEDPTVFALDPAGEPSRFPETAVASDGGFRTRPGTTTFDLPLLLGGTVPFRLEQAVVSGRLGVDAPGFSLLQGRLEGYFTKDALIDAVIFIQDLCLGPEAPPYCEPVLLFFPPGSCERTEDGDGCDDAVRALSTIVGGFEVQVAPDGRVSSCAAQDCNAVGVCFTLDLRGVTITGPAQ